MLQKIIRSLIIGIVIAIPTTFLSLAACIAGLNASPFGQTLSSLMQNPQFNNMFGCSFTFILLGLVIAGVLAAPSSKTSKPSSSGDSSAAPVEMEGDREFGTVKWFNSSKGFGFITRDQGDDIFVHYRSIRGEGHRSLREGQKVDFVVTEGEKGLQAEDVIPAAK